MSKYRCVITSQFAAPSFTLSCSFSNVFYIMYTCSKITIFYRITPSQNAENTEWQFCVFIRLSHLRTAAKHTNLRSPPHYFTVLIQYQTLWRHSNQVVLDSWGVKYRRTTKNSRLCTILSLYLGNGTICRAITGSYT